MAILEYKKEDDGSNFIWDIVGCEIGEIKKTRNFSRTKFKEGSQVAKLPEYTLLNKHFFNEFSWESLEDAPYSFNKCFMKGINLEGVFMPYCLIGFSDLSNSNLRHAFLSHGSFAHSNLEKANLKKANLACANLEHTSLVDSYLVDTNFTGASLVGSNLKKANLKKANLACANLIGVKGLDEAINLGKATFNKTLVTPYQKRVIGEQIKKQDPDFYDCNKNSFFNILD